MKNIPFSLFNKLNWLIDTIYFFRTHFMVVMGLGLVAAFGRIIQLKGFGEITSWMNIVLEVIVDSARILLFLYVLGLASIKKGVLRIKHFFTDGYSKKIYWSVLIQELKKQWFSVLMNVIGFLLIAWVINHLIDLLAYETCFYFALKKNGILANTSSEWAILLFFKNLSVIPFMLIFDAVFLLWITKKLQHSKTISLE